MLEETYFFLKICVAIYNINSKNTSFLDQISVFLFFGYFEKPFWRDSMKDFRRFECVFWFSFIPLHIHVCSEHDTQLREVFYIIYKIQMSLCGHMCECLLRLWYCCEIIIKQWINSKFWATGAPVTSAYLSVARWWTLKTLTLALHICLHDG